MQAAEAYDEDTCNDVSFGCEAVGRRGAQKPKKKHPAANITEDC